jgi:hypothetical protein
MFSQDAAGAPAHAGARKYEPPQDSTIANFSMSFPVAEAALQKRFAQN